MRPAFYDAEQVADLLDYPGCIKAMRQAMTSLSQERHEQPLRQVVEIGPGRRLGVMSGSLTAANAFGAKVVSVFPDPAAPGRTRHQGVVMAYDAATGSVACLADAEAVTRIRTACASAAATDVLARPDARVLAVFGGGVQAAAHIRALGLVRPLERVLIWSRSVEQSRERAEGLSQELGFHVSAASGAQAAAQAADIICTVTSAIEPVVYGDWVSPGTHVNLVGSSYLGPVEIDSRLVAKARYIADHRPSVLSQASELAVARAAGVVDDTHVVGEIGDVFAGVLSGRQAAEQITLYKSLGHVVQDLAAAAYLHGRALSEGLRR